MRCDLGHNNSPRRVESIDSDVMNVYVDRWKRFDLRHRLGGISKVFILKKKKPGERKKKFPNMGEKLKGAGRDNIHDALSA